MSAHTPGPWFATTTPAGKGKVVDANGWSIANATATPCTQGLADARLIAAAPELLEALDELLSGVMDIRGIDIEAYKPTEVALARAAIAKARGGA